jgi:hypothetical protein
MGSLVDSPWMPNENVSSDLDLEQSYCHAIAHCWPTLKLAVVASPDFASSSTVEPFCSDVAFAGVSAVVDGGLFTCAAVSCTDGTGVVAEVERLGGLISEGVDAAASSSDTIMFSGKGAAISLVFSCALAAAMFAHPTPSPDSRKESRRPRAAHRSRARAPMQLRSAHPDYARRRRARAARVTPPANPEAARRYALPRRRAVLSGATRRTLWNRPVRSFAPESSLCNEPFATRGYVGSRAPAKPNSRRSRGTRRERCGSNLAPCEITFSSGRPSRRPFWPGARGRGRTAARLRTRSRRRSP